MASPRNHSSILFTLIFIISSSIIIFLHSKSAESKFIITSGKEKTNMEIMLGSRPPRCVNKCMNCKPCKPFLVIPPDDDHHKELDDHATSATASHHGDQTYYYLLSWKCRCGNKNYQP